MANRKNEAEKRARLHELEEESRITVGDLMDHLKAFPRDTQITFGSSIDGELLGFYRVKIRGDNLIQIETSPILEE